MWSASEEHLLIKIKMLEVSLIVDVISWNSGLDPGFQLMSYLIIYVIVTLFVCLFKIRLQFGAIVTWTTSSSSSTEHLHGSGLWAPTSAADQCPEWQRQPCCECREFPTPACTCPLVWRSIHCSDRKKKSACTVFPTPTCLWRFQHIKPQSCWIL